MAQAQLDQVGAALASVAGVAAQAQLDQVGAALASVAGVAAEAQREQARAALASVAGVAAAFGGFADPTLSRLDTWCKPVDAGRGDRRSPDVAGDTSSRAISDDEFDPSGRSLAISPASFMPLFIAAAICIAVAATRPEFREIAIDVIDISVDSINVFARLVWFLYGRASDLLPDDNVVTWVWLLVLLKKALLTSKMTTAGTAPIE